MLRGQYGLCDDVAECRTQTAAGGVDMALAAFEAQLNGEIGFGVRAERGEAKGCEQAAQRPTSVRSIHGAGSTVNSNVESAPNVAAFILAKAPPPLPRSV